MHQLWRVGIQRRSADNAIDRATAREGHEIDWRSTGGAVVSTPARTTTRNAQSYEGELPWVSTGMGKRGHLPPPFLPSGNAVKDELFMHYYQDLSSASGDLAPRLPPWLHPWTPLGDFRPKKAVASPAMGLWGTSPSTFNNFICSSL